MKIIRTKMVEINGEIIEVQVCRPSNRKAGLSLTSERFQKNNKGEYCARERGLIEQTFRCPICHSRRKVDNMTPANKNGRAVWVCEEHEVD